VASPHFRWPRFLFPVVTCALLAALGVTYYLVRRAPETPVMAFSDFVRQIEAGGVTQVRFGETNMSAMSSLPHSGESRPIGDTDRGSEQTPELRKYTRAIHMSFDVSSDPPPP